jgi:16S rRNA (guanine(966)-N(2))-methyltransferase RsmD
LRIVAGKWGGRPLRAPRGLSVRPTADRVREAVFGILGGRVGGASVLDLFAGTGAMALEALSRGASDAVLVESSREAFASLSGNVKALGAAEAVCLPLDYRKAIRRLASDGRVFSIVFLDPPYGRGLVARSAAEIHRAGILSPGAVVVAERAAREPDDPVPEGWVERTDRRYGDTRVTLYDVPGPRGQADAAGPA